jgi:Flp pilus assembly protein TadG
MTTHGKFREQPKSQSQTWRRQDAESGATLVETAISLLLFFMFIMGIMEVSLALYSYHVVSDAAREGTRYAMVRGSDWSTGCDGSGSAGSGYSSSGCIASAADVEKFVASLGFLDITTSDVCVQFLTSLPSSASSSCTAASSTTEVPAAGNIVQVTITYPFSFGLPGMPSEHKYTYSLTSTSQMVIAQ